MGKRSRGIGTTFAEAELMNDAGLMKAIRRAEEKYGINTGVRFSESGEHLVSVQFHPSTRFFIQDKNPEDGSLSPPRDLSHEEFDGTWKLRL